MPRASDMPPLILGETVTPNPFHPLGVKGVGEVGCNGAPAVANAVMDALAPLGIDHIDMPYTAPKLWEAIQAAQGKARADRAGGVQPALPPVPINEPPPQPLQHDTPSLS